MQFVPWIAASVHNIFIPVNKTPSRGLDRRKLETKAENLQDSDDGSGDDPDSTRR
jgi:hypothetical protein